MRRLLVLGLIVCLLVTAWPRPANPQLAVVDVTSIFHLIQIFQQMLQLVGLSTKDLLALSALPVVLTMAQEILDTVQDIQGLVTELDTRHQGWSQLAGGSAGLCDAASYAAWAGQASAWSEQGVSLLTDATRIVGRLINLMGSVQRLAATIASLTGSTSGLMALNAQVATSNTILMKLYIAMIPVQQQNAGVQLIQDVTTRAMACMKAGRFNRQ